MYFLSTHTQEDSLMGDVTLSSPPMEGDQPVERTTYKGQKSKLQTGRYSLDCNCKGTGREKSQLWIELIVVR